MFRWSQILADFDLDEISYIPGGDNVIADYLSRPNDTTIIPLQSALDHEIRQRADLTDLDPTLLCTISLSQEGDVMKVSDGDAGVVTHCYALATDNKFTADVIKNCQHDRYFAQVLQEIQQGNLVRMQRRTYFLRDKVLFLKDSLGRERVCIPYHSRATFLRLIHDDSCHVGKTKTFLKASQIAFWTMSKDVANYINSCAECLQGKSYKQRVAGEPRERFEKVSVDLLTALPTSKRGNESFLVFLDQFSNRGFLYPCKKSITSKGEARAYFETVYRAQGICKTLVLDNGSLYSSEFWTELFALMGIDVRHSSVYHPQSQGRVEKFNSVIVEALRIYCLRQDRKVLG